MRTPTRSTQTVSALRVLVGTLVAAIAVGCTSKDNQDGKAPSGEAARWAPHLAPRPTVAQWRKISGSSTTPLFRILAAAPQLALDTDRFCSVPPADTQTDLSKIELVLQGNSASWYSNDVFTGHPNAASFKPFYPATTLPSNVRPITPYQEPGNYTTTVGFNRVLVGLSSIGCTQRYGGSIRLTFTSREDLQYDFGDGTYLWDFGELKLHVFVVPVPQRFNFPTLARDAIVHIEVEPSNVTRYTLATREVSPPATGTDAALNAALQSAANGIEATPSRTLLMNVPGNASSFVYGYIRDRFSDRFTSWTELVDGVEVSDDVVDLVTHTGSKQYYLSVRINEIDLNTEPGSEEFKVDITNMNDDYTVKDIELDEDEASDYQTIARISGSRCSGTKVYAINIDMVEEDPVVDDMFSAPTQYPELDCAQLAAAPGVGPLESHRSDNITLFKGVGTERVGWLSLSFRVGVLLK